MISKKVEKIRNYSFILFAHSLLQIDTHRFFYSLKFCCFFFRLPDFLQFSCIFRVFVFAGPRPWPQPPICIYRPWPPICIYRPPLQIFIYWPWSVRSLGLQIPTLSPQPVFTGSGLRFLLPCSEFAFTFLQQWLVAVAAVLLAIAVISQDYIIPIFVCQFQ